VVLTDAVLPVDWTQPHPELDGLHHPEATIGFPNGGGEPYVDLEREAAALILRE
jgi:hypothetical protein